MIFLTRMNKEQFFINPDQIVSIEETPDTVITLFNNHHFIVMESAQVIINKIIAFRSRIIRRAGVSTGSRHHLKQRKRLFRNVTLNRDDIGPVERDNCRDSPLHVRDF